MPNQRKKGKHLMAAWVPEAEVREFKARAKEMGYTMTDLLTLLIREELKRNTRNTQRKENKDA